MKNPSRIITAIAVAIFGMGAIIGTTSTPASADTETDCTTVVAGTPLPPSLSCEKTAADEACAANGPTSNECLTARNVYLSELVSRDEPFIDALQARISMLMNDIAAYQRQIQHQAKVIKRLRERLHSGG